MNPDDHRELERELRALVPRAPNVELAKLMYLAGQASLSPVPPVAPIAAAPLWRAQWWWPASTAAACTAAAWLGVLLVLAHHKDSLSVSSPRAIVQPHPFHPAPAAPPNLAPAMVAIDPPRATINSEEAVYIRDRNAVIEAGADALAGGAVPSSTPAAPAAGQAVPSKTLRRELGISPPIKAGWGWSW